MKSYRCASCGCETSAPLPPRVCKQCGATGGGFALVPKMPSATEATSSRVGAALPRTAPSESLISGPLRRRPAPPPDAALATSPRKIVERDSRVVCTVPGQPRERSQPVRQRCAIDHAGQMVACIDDRLIAADVSGDGLRVLWEIDLGSFIPGPPVVGPNGTIHVHSGDGKFHFIRSDGAVERPAIDVGPPLASAAPIVDSSGVAWICRYEGGIIRIDPLGEDRLFFRSRETFDCAAYLQGDRLYAAAGDNCVYAISLSGERGRSLWDHAVGRGTMAWFANGAIVPLPDSTILATCRDADNHLYAFDEEGALAWSFRLPGMALGSPVVGSDSAIYVALRFRKRGAADTGALYCLDGRRRSQRWVAAIDCGAESTPTIGSDGVVYFGDDIGRVHAISPEGRSIWSAQAGAAIRSPGTFVGEGLIAFGLENGTFAVVRCESPGLASGGWPQQGGP